MIFDAESVRWIIGGLLIIIAALIGVLWGIVGDELKKSRIFRHTTAPAQFATINTQLIRHSDKLIQHDRDIQELKRNNGDPR